MHIDTESVVFSSFLQKHYIVRNSFFLQTVRTLMTFHLGLQCLPKCLSADILNEGEIQP